MLQSTQPFEVVCLYDPAIDGSVSDVIAYGRSRDLSKITFKAGQEPVRFWVERMSRRLMLRHVAAADSENERYTRAFSCAVVRVTGLEGKHEFRPQQQLSTPVGQVRMVTEEELERFAIADILEIGAVAFWRSFLRPGNEASYPLLASSATAYDMMHPASLPAEGSETE